MNETVIQTNPSEERRQALRIAGNIPLKISSDDFDVVTETRNLSCSGAYCRVNQYVEPMTKLKVQLLLPFKRKDKVVTKKVSCGGVIVRTEAVSNQSLYNVAIFFNDISSRDSGYIAEYISAFLAQQNQ